MGYILKYSSNKARLPEYPSMSSSLSTDDFGTTADSEPMGFMLKG